jgi:murein DD-endopeptidase MepM/ murein hydrolase activator NlpD
MRLADIADSNRSFDLEEIQDKSLIAELLLECPDVLMGLYRPTNGEGIVTSPFGMRGSPPRPHKGIDIGAPKGTSIYAIADGTIASLVSGCLEGNYRCGGGYGNVIYLMHRGLAFDQTRYAHLDRIASGLTVGNDIKRGQLLGYMGNTGHSFGSHLHFEIRVNGVAKNPIHYLNPIV